MLLLATRAAMLALLALALARATLGPVAAVTASGPVAVVVIMDDSLSMSARSSQGRTAFDIGKDEAAGLLDGLPEGSTTAVLAGSEPERREPLGLSTDTSSTLSSLRGMPLTWRHVALAPALRAAFRLLSAQPLQDRRVVLVTDLSRHAFEGMELPPVEGARPQVLPVVPLPRDERTNRSVSGLDAENLPDGRLRVAARVTAWGTTSEKTDVEVRVGALGTPPKVMGRGPITPGAGASAERRFELSAPPEGYGVVEARIEEDFLPADDVRQAANHAARRPRVLVVDGDPQNIALGSETFYVEQALAPGVGLDFDAQVVTLAELDPKSFEGRDVVVLLNAPELSVERARSLEQAVDAGTGLVVALGNRVDQPTYNGRLQALLPATVGVPREREQPQAVRAAPGRLELPRVHVRGWFSLEPDPGTFIAYTLADGTPLLVEGSAGAGRVVLLGTTLDRDWNDMPISPLFLPFLQQLLDSVTSRRQAQVLAPVFPGAPVDLRAIVAQQAAEPRPLPLSVRTPDGTLHALAEDGIWPDTDQLGVYDVEPTPDGAGAGWLGAAGARVAWAVVPDPLESDLTRLGPDDLAALVGDAATVRGAREGEGSAAGGLPAWKALLLLLVAATALESWLARKAA